MVVKFILVAVLVASVSASGGYSSFSYGVSDPNTGDIKDQQENRVDGNVVGKYSLIEADGTKRIVEYSADDATGFKAVVHKEPAGTYGAAAIGNPLGRPGHLTQPGVLGNSIAHHAVSTLNRPGPLAAVSSLNHHVTSLAAISPLSHGAVPAAAHAEHAAAAHAAKVAHANKAAQAAHAAAPLARAGAISSIAPVAPIAHSSILASSASLAHGAPEASFGAPSPLSHGVYGNNLVANAALLSGHPGSLYPGNPLAGSLNYANRGAPAVSSYSHRIVHNGPDAFPNGGAYGRYGAYGHGGLGPYGTGLAGSAFGHGNPWASGAALATSNPWSSGAALATSNPWTSGAALAPSNPWAPNAALAHGALTSHAAALGSRLGW